jgi:hypothetical protein
MAASAGEPDLEVAALHRRMAAADAGIAGEVAGPARSSDEGRDETIESLLREVEVQRELLRERNRLLARERARLRRITESRSYRLYGRLRRLPGVRSIAGRRDRRRVARASARRAQRARTRRERTERYVNHHRERRRDAP